MKILYLTQFLPLPLDHGGVIKTYSTLKVLKKLGHEMTIFSYITNTQQIKYIKALEKEGFRIGYIGYNHNLNDEYPIRKLVFFIRNLFNLKPFNVYKFYTKYMKESIDNYLSQEKIDCFWIDHFSMAQFIPSNFTKSKILETHNIESVFFKKMFLNDQFLRWKIFALHEWLKFIIYGRKYYYKFNKIFTISITDKLLLKKITKLSNIEVLPPIIKPKTRQFKKKVYNTLLFIGSLCWYPNKDGIYWFLKKIYPAILKQIPDIQLWIVGQLPRRFIFPKLKGVHFFGYQKSLKSFYSKASLFVVPIRYGSGIRIKILEATAWKIPILSTSAGIEGISFIKKKEVMITSAIEAEFSQKIQFLLNNKKLQENLTSHSSLLLKKYYSYHNIISILRKHI